MSERNQFASAWSIHWSDWNSVGVTPSLTDFTAGYLAALASVRKEMPPAGDGKRMDALGNEYMSPKVEAWNAYRNEMSAALLALEKAAGWGTG